MKLLFLSDARSFHTKRWVDYFVNQGYESYLFSLEKSQGTKAFEIFISPKSEYPLLKYLLALPQLKKIIKEIEPDLVNAHFIPNYGFLGALSKRKPLVVSAWGSDVLVSSKKSFFHRTRAKYVLTKADLVTCDGMNMFQELCALGVEKDKIVLAPMGVELNLLRERSISGRFENKEEIIILSMRSLEPVYDLKTLIKAVPLIISQTHKKLEFWIIGEGSQKEELVKLSLNLGIERNIEFRGYISREELEDCLQKADIYISTSLSDSTSVSLLEAMASGLLPVVSDIPGNREWIEEGKNGFLFPIGDYQALAQKIVWVINDFKDIEKLRMENHKIIREKALWEENMKIIEGKFLELFKR
ncbi:MAG: glycosyltransferase family 4 protein [candidate division Zixibacteria bacterium]|nr:glycosyltransferase family 4 protein [candidate division Zixibacteria bacterium]